MLKNRDMQYIKAENNKLTAQTHIREERIFKPDKECQSNEYLIFLMFTFLVTGLVSPKQSQSHHVCINIYIHTYIHTHTHTYTYTHTDR